MIWQAKKYYISGERVSQHHYIKTKGDIQSCPNYRRIKFI